MTFERKVDREKAATLRKLGWKYQDIADELGCSKEWCCANLKNINPDLAMMREAYNLHKYNNKPRNDAFIED